MDDMFDCTTKLFPGAPVLLASQKYQAVSESSSLAKTRVLLRIPDIGVEENVSTVKMMSVSSSSSPFLYQTMDGTGRPVAAQVMLIVPPRKCSTLSTGSSTIIVGTTNNQVGKCISNIQNKSPVVQGVREGRKKEGKGGREGERGGERQTDRKTEDRQANRQRDRVRNRETERETRRQTDRQTDTEKDREEDREKETREGERTVRIVKKGQKYEVKEKPCT